MTEDSSESGWELLASHDEAPALVAALLEMEPDTVYARSAIAEQADVALKTLYVGETLEALAGIGLLERLETEGDEEARFRLVDGEVLAAARAFEEAAG
jgi:hypothetical protein